MKLHEKIYRLRTEKKLSQGDLAEILNVSRQSVSKWETGASVPDLDKLVKMSDLFGVTLDDLVRDEIESMSENTPKTKESRDEQDQVQNTVIVQETLPVRKLFGALLFVGAFILLFIAWPLSVFASLLGAVCFIFRKHTLLWCAWFTYFSMDIYMVTGTGINRKSVFLPHAYGVWGVRILVHWAYLLLLVALIAWTLYTFRHVRFAVMPRRKTALALGWIAAFGVLPLINIIVSKFATEKLTDLIELSGGVFTVGSDLYAQHTFYIRLMSSVSFVSSWIQIVSFSVLLIFTLALIRMRRERKNSSVTLDEKLI